MKEERKDYQYVFRVYEKKGDKEYDLESVIVNNVTKEAGLERAENKMFYICNEDYNYARFELDQICEYHVPHCVIDGDCDLDPIFSAVNKIAINKIISDLDIVSRSLDDKDYEVTEGQLRDLDRYLYFARYTCILSDTEYYHYQFIVDDYWWQLRRVLKYGKAKKGN